MASSVESPAARKKRRLAEDMDSGGRKKSRGGHDLKMNGSDRLSNGTHDMTVAIPNGQDEVHSSSFPPLFLSVISCCTIGWRREGRNNND